MAGDGVVSQSIQDEYDASESQQSSSVVASDGVVSHQDENDVSEIQQSGSVADDSVESQSSSNHFTPPLFNAPSCSDSASSNATRSKEPSRAIVNPLVTAGLIPSNLSDILSPPSSSKQPRRRVIKARVLTEEEFTQTLREKERKEKEADEKKERNRQERERKRVAREEAQLEKEKRKEPE